MRGLVTVTAAQTEKIIKSEVRRAGKAPGYDYDDMTQEARAAAAYALTRVDPSLSSGLTFSRVAVRRHLRRIKQTQTRQKRFPRDANGSLLMPASLDKIEFTLAAEPGQVEDILDLSSLLEACKVQDIHGLLSVVESLSEASLTAIQAAYSDPKDRMAAFADILSGRQKHKRVIEIHERTRRPMTALIEPVMPGAFETPVCHSEGAEPQGYDKTDAACHSCPDKFSCLKKGLENRVVDGALEDDAEVWALWTGRMTYGDVISRMTRREEFLRTHKDAEEPVPVPESLSTVDPALFKLPVLGQKASVITPKKPKQVKAVTKLDKPPAPRKLPPLKKPKYKDGSTYKIPGPRSLSADEMQKAIERINVGQTRKLKVGHSLVRTKRGGKEVVVELREDGFLWNGTIYPSLSGAVMNSEQRCVSGNDFFSLARLGTLIIDEKGNKIS